MSPRNLQNIPSATWQWADPLKSFLLIIIIVVWGHCLEICKEQSNYTPEFQQLMGLGSFIVTFAFSLLVESIFTHIFAYVQGIFLLSRRGIPFQSIIIGGNPLQVSVTCFTMIKQKQISIIQLLSYLGTLVIYILSFSIGAYATSTLGTPYIMDVTPFKWIQVPTVLTQELNNSMYNAFVEDNFLGAFTNIQMNHLFSWVERTKDDISEIAFMPLTITELIKGLEQNLTLNIQSNNQYFNSGLAKWKLEKTYNNVDMQYLASQCSANIIPSCEIDGRESVYVMAGKENQTISWRLCNLHYNTMNTSMQIDCNISIKGGIFPLITFEYPSVTQQPREEYLSQVLIKKNELKELKEIKNNLFAIMEDVLLRPLNNSDPITKNVAIQLASAWNCEPENVTCAQSKGTTATIRYVGALLDTASVMYLAEISKNITELLKNNSSTTGFFRSSHRVCLGGTNPMQSIGLMIAIPLIIIIIGLLPLLYNNKLWWLAADIGNNYIAFIRSISPCGENWDNELPECIARRGETKFKKTVRLNVKDNHIGLSSSLNDNKT
ncbi:1427_t:CDS:1 [Dentiscutata erythropus]|uniref:1427_t:CDS:1 n=1 Tax=Dentiscutata erythropus TaxID=1348616 RepID=A0A9N8ZFK1_9GLOM|nr:1427_t:CDS:1 [Dentiscutata erythropus]